ncbi:hypothetical protein LTR62_004303 [Meristemomyces frigidus]|uniref:Uncharacterized protein n=1 Tax=Meristemomyces frigidus TaxID=1508187 RepID=A0AAN7TES7_9PEZI|nr:hypothetical protein LTR62_004303 [Meristemomyces frigidus]
MSSRSQSAESHETIKTEHGEVFLGEEKTSTDNGRAGQTNSARADDTHGDGPDVRKGSGRRYRDLINLAISEVAETSRPPDEPLGPSQVGASYWTSLEKELLFCTLQKTGRTNLRALRRAIETKTEAEIGVYLALLGDGLDETAFNRSRKEEYLHVPAAFEIDRELEARLDDAADSLRRKIELRDDDQEQERYGDDWLVDEKLAAHIESQIEVLEDVADSAQQPVSASGVQGTQSDVQPAYELLSPAIMLHLSSTLFMNASLGSEQNWRELLPSDGSLDGPAMYRTAFEDLHNLVVSLTRRLVQASLYQASSRLRANDASRTNWHPSADVREVDVRSVVDILGVRPSCGSYWTSFPERSGMDVYTGIKKYRDGRQTSKNGVQLTPHEIRFELSGGSALLPNVNADDERAEVTLSDYDSDDLTSTSSSDSASVSDAYDDEGSDDQKDQVLIFSMDEHRVSAKRKRQQSPSALLETETLYLEHIDQEASKEEQNRLLQLLGEAPTRLLATSEVPARPSILFNDSNTPGTWTEKTRFQSLWERNDGEVPESAFVAMGVAGVAGREKRRKLLGKSTAVESGMESAKAEATDDDEEDERAVEEDGEEDGDEDGEEDGEEDGHVDDA